MLNTSLIIWLFSLACNPCNFWRPLCIHTDSSPAYFKFENVDLRFMTDHISWKKKIKTKRERKANPSNLIPDLNPWVFWRRIINFNIEQSYRKRGSSIQNEVTKGWVFRYNTCLYTNTESTWSIYLVNKWMYKLTNEYAVKFAWKIPHEVWGNHPSSLKPRLCTYVSHFYMPDICWQLSISYCST